MPAKPNWRDLISWRFWLYTAVVDIIIGGIWLGFSKLFTVLPIVRDIGFLVLLIAGMFCVAHYLPNMVLHHATEKTKSNAGVAHKKPSRLEHDNVLWEDAGRDGWGHISVIGPLCPKDLTPLGSECRDKIESHINYDNLVSDSQYHSRLFCLECKSKYTLGAEPKTTKDSLNEVRNLFEGKRRREQETK